MKIVHNNDLKEVPFKNTDFNDYAESMENAQKWARIVGIKGSDIEDAIKAVRLGENRKKNH
ncbi:hypothetical protein SAMN02910298_01916 [Pseudobutyrivibrio sp. YE44]|uniref:hypothetical protein n=1 Tax=Pseudobutyrivibrio sp. YE44 TaxID=1520802 RepID=UPI000883797E|nr:hypothetical protein [Pseudobutyrivibrio sp. YE44]SDB38887.1 hypothetical protein SAMN02910298_01916 [Pseudobutyrivibrio sp. YE44]